MALKLSDLPTHEEMVANILSTYTQADSEAFENGSKWYDNTRMYCELLGEAYGYPTENVAGAYAVLSPSSKKERNDIDALCACAWHRAGIPVGHWVALGTYGRSNRLKASRCLDGDLSAVGGKKVTAFFNNIMGYNKDVPTVDRWAARIACNLPHGAEQAMLVTSAKVYNAIADAYAQAASQVNVSAREMQSCTWEVFRRKYYHNGTPAFDVTKRLIAAAREAVA